jgi:hypothetical protein
LKGDIRRAEVLGIGFIKVLLITPDLPKLSQGGILKGSVGTPLHTLGVSITQVTLYSYLSFRVKEDPRRVIIGSTGINAGLAALAFCPTYFLINDSSPGLLINIDSPKFAGDHTLRILTLITYLGFKVVNGASEWVICHLYSRQGRLVFTLMVVCRANQFTGMASGAQARIEKEIPF